MRVTVDEARQQAFSLQISHQQTRHRYVVGVVDDGEYLAVTDQQVANAEVLRRENLRVGD